MYRSLIPKSTLLTSTAVKLTSILKDYEDYAKGLNNQFKKAYDTAYANEDQLQALIDSFSLGELYASLPVYYKGAKVDYNDVPYTDPLNKVAFMRVFLDTMLRQRKNIGVYKIFDVALSVLGEQERRFGVFQNFIFVRQSDSEEFVVKKLAYTNIDIPEYWRVSPRGADHVTVAPGVLYIESTGIQTNTVTVWTYRNNILSQVVDDGAGNLTGDVDPAGVNTINYATGAIDVTFDFAADGHVSDTSVWVTYTFDPISYLLDNGFSDLGYTAKDLSYPYVGLGSSVLPSETVPPTGADVLYSPDNEAGYYIPTQTITLEMFTSSGVVATSTELLIAIKRIFSFMKPTHVLLEDFGPIVSLSTENSFFSINWSSKDMEPVPYPNQGFPNGLYPDEDHSFEDGYVNAAGEQTPAQEAEHSNFHPSMHQPGPVPEWHTDGTFPEHSVASHRLERIDSQRENDLNPCVGGFFYTGDPGPLGPTIDPWFFLMDDFGGSGQSYIQGGWLR